jgi:hypothetical protein
VEEILQRFSELRVLERIAAGDEPGGFYTLAGEEKPVCHFSEHQARRKRRYREHGGT